MADGVVERKADAEDGRGRLIVFTAAGRRLLADANTVKEAIEARYRDVLGPKRFAELVAMLEELNGRE